jgi:hypothetical protein
MIEDKVISRIYGKQRGWVFTPNDFKDLAARGAIDVALGRLLASGTIRRLAHGLYDYPVSPSRFVIVQQKPVPDAGNTETARGTGGTGYDMNDGLRVRGCVGTM